MSEQNEIIPAKKRTMAPVAAGPRGLVLSSMDDMVRFAHAVSESGLAPKGIDKPQAILVAVQMGLELGLSPMAALQNIAIINGRPGLFGDAALALVRDSGLLLRYAEWYEVNGKRLQTPEGHPRTPSASEVKDDTCTAYALAERMGDGEPNVTGFSTADAKLAGLWGKAGPWTQYPARMLKWRARGFCLRDKFGDVLKGLHTAEEIADEAPRPSRTEGVAAKLLARRPAAEIVATPDLALKLRQSMAKMGLGEEVYRAWCAENDANPDRLSQEQADRCLIWLEGLEADQREAQAERAALSAPEA